MKAYISNLLYKNAEDGPSQRTVNYSVLMGLCCF